jgi:hypothetical protein
VPARSVGALAVVAAFAALVIFGAGCGTASNANPIRRVDQSQVELQLVLRAKERLSRLTIGKARCPADVAARVGETFECSVDVEGQRARYNVTISEILGNEAQYDFRPAQAIVEPSAVADFIKNRLDEHWKTARIDCGQAKVRLADVGATIDCTVFDGVATRYIQAVVEDRDGTVTLKER